MSWWIVIDNVFIIFVAIQYGEWRERRKIDVRLPYKWKCDEKNCTFIVNGEEPSTVDHIISNHRDYHRDKNA